MSEPAVADRIPAQEAHLGPKRIPEPEKAVTPRADREPRAPFGDIVCAVGGSPGSVEATRQAIALCGPATALRFVAARHNLGRDPSLPADLTEMQARNSLELAIAMAGRAGIRASVALARDQQVSELLLVEATQHELVVLGRRSGATFDQAPLGRSPRRLDEIRKQRAVIAEEIHSAPHPDSDVGCPVRSLIVVGRSRCQEAIAGSATSDRVLREARCSVMVVPSPARAT